MASPGAAYGDAGFRPHDYLFKGERARTRAPQTPRLPLTLVRRPLHARSRRQSCCAATAAWARYATPAMPSGKCCPRADEHGRTGRARRRAHTDQRAGPVHARRVLGKLTDHDRRRVSDQGRRWPRGAHAIAGHYGQCAADTLTGDAHERARMGARGRRPCTRANRWRFRSGTRVRGRSW